MNEQNKYPKAVLNLVIAAISLLFIIFVVPKILTFFLPFVIGWIISMIANPIVKWLEKRVKIVRKHSSAIIVVGVIVLVIVLLYYIIALLARETMNLAQDLPNIYADLEEQLQRASKSLGVFFDKLPVDFKGTVNRINKNANEYVTDFITNLEPSFSLAGSIVKNVAETFFMTIITILSAYFFIAERENLIVRIKKHTPVSVQDRYTLIMDNFKRAVGGYLRAQVKITLIITVIIFIGLEILRVDYSFFIAFLVAFVDLLPIFGTGAIFWPWALIDVLSGNYVRAIGIMVIYLICQVVRQILQPKMVGDSIGVSPLMTLVFMFIGYKFKGVLGMILGLPIGMIIMNFYRAGLFDDVIYSMKTLLNGINNFRKR